MEIKPCPFCGSNPVHETIYAEEPEISIYCSNTKCPAHEFCSSVEQWNRRTPPAGWKLVPVDVTKIPHVAWDNAITAYQLATKKHGFYESCFAGYHAFLRTIEGEP